MHMCTYVCVYIYTHMQAKPHKRVYGYGQADHKSWIKLPMDDGSSASMPGAGGDSAKQLLKLPAPLSDPGRDPNWVAVRELK